MRVGRVGNTKNKSRSMSIIMQGLNGVDAQNDIPLEKIYHTNLTFIQNQNGQKSINVNSKSKYLQSSGNYLWQEPFFC